MNVPGRDVSGEREQPTLDDVTDAVRSLVDVMRANGLTELDVTSGAVSIRLRAPKGGGPKASSLSVGMSPTPPPHEVVSAEHTVTAPMIGTFYASPSPGDPPFVRIGDHIQAGQTIGIIEAMKIMNEIVADRSGVVIDILARNAEAVEYGSPLLRIDPEKDSDE